MKNHDIAANQREQNYSFAGWAESNLDPVISNSLWLHVSI
jgi:hypothetical protein